MFIVGLPPSCVCAAWGMLNFMFSAPERDLPSKTPLPLNDTPPMPSMLMFAWKATRADSVSAVFVAALATGSNESVSPPQPASATGLTARQSRARVRRRVIRK